MKIEITACVIVKNEAKNIGAWLACMAQFADEIVVVDTGSTDETTDIVRSFAAHGKRARLYAFPWTGDFSAAKNFALGKAHGNWI
ncbi:glycosyltransferase, partial [Selenomonas sp.]